MFDILNEDFATYEAFEPFLKKAVNKGREVPGGSILQVQSIVNCSIAKQDGHQQYDPERHILKVTLTDGDSTIHALVADPIPRLTINTPPGTKVKILNTIPTHGQIMLVSKANVQILGGEVPKLIEKWNFQRSMDIKKEWGAVGKPDGNDGPPLWQAFGHKSIPLDVVVLRKMKAMDIVNEKKEAAGGEGSQTQFDQQRSEAITELMEKSVKQKWQKPTKQLIDKEVQEIIDEGFSYEEASNAMDKYKNQQKALRYLKASRGEYPPTRTAAPEDRKEKKRRGKADEDEEDYVPIPKEYQRPTNNISLFGFIADSMNIKGGDASDQAQEVAEKQEYENYGSRGRGRGRGGRGDGAYSRDGHRGRGRGGRMGQGAFGSSNPNEGAYSRYENASNVSARDAGQRGRASDVRNYNTRGGGPGFGGIDSERNFPSFDNSSTGGYARGGGQRGRMNDDRSYTRGGGGHRGERSSGFGSGSNNFASYDNSSREGFSRSGQRGGGRGASSARDYSEKKFSIYDNSPALPSPQSDAQSGNYNRQGNGLVFARSGSDRGSGRGRYPGGHY